MKEKINQITSVLKRHRTLVSNFGYLSVLQVVTMIVPLITLPYLLKVLGAETYGLVVFAQSIVAYFVIVISFGFNISATKEVSENVDNKNKLSEIVSSVFIIKGALFFLSLLILSILVFVIPDAEEYKLLFYLSMYAALYEWLFPVWYFRGIERMKYITIINMVSRLTFLVLIFLLVKKEGDFEKVPLINGIGSLIAGFAAIWIIFIKHKVAFVWCSKEVLSYYVKDSAPLFWGSLIGKLKIVSNKTILGLFVGMESVAIFDIADKLRMVIQSFLDIIVVVIFPNVSKTKNSKSIRNALKIIGISGVFVYLAVLLILWIFVPLYFNEYAALVSVFAIIGTIIFIQSSSYLIGVGVLVVNDLKRQYTFSLFMPTLAYLVLFGAVYYLNILNIYSISIILVFSLLYELVFRINTCRKNNLLHWLK